MCVQVTLLASISAAKQLKLTYYMERDGIVKSIDGLIRAWLKCIDVQIDDI
jgi:hypothetical protein